MATDRAGQDAPASAPLDAEHSFDVVRILLSVVLPAIIAAVIIVVDLVAHPHGHADLAGVVKTTLFAGIGSMVLIETAKRLFPFRAAFQFQLVRRRLVEQARAPRERSDAVTVSGQVVGVSDSVVPSRVVAAIGDMIGGELGGPSIDGAFNLPVEQLMPQLADAIRERAIRPADTGIGTADAAPAARIPADDVSLSGPSRTEPRSVQAGATTPSRLSVALFGHGEVAEPGIDGGGDTGPRPTTTAPSVSLSVIPPQPVERDTSAEFDLQIERRMGRFLEGLQIEIGNRWRHYVRSIATCVSGLIGLVVSYAAPPDVAVSYVTPIAALFGGGFVAWLARDITAVIERWRR